MKVILYMAITANGFIAGKDDCVDWISKNSWRGYMDKVKQIKCAIVGRRTYELMPEDEFVKGCTYIIFTHKKELAKKSPNVKFFSDSPKEVLNILKKEGIKQVCILGGGKLSSSFMKEKLIDEIYLDVEPVILSKGIQLFSEGDFEANLELIGTKKLSDNEIQLHYRVKK